MTRVNEDVQLSARVVTDPIEREELRWFHLQRCVESGSLARLPKYLPPDPLVSQADYVGVYAGNTIVGTMRLVGGAPEIFRHHEFFPHIVDGFQQHTIVEITKLAVTPDSQRFRALRRLLKELLYFALQAPEDTVLLASVRPGMVKTLNRIFSIPVDVIGPEMDRYGDFFEPTVPIRFDTDSGLPKLQQQRGDAALFQDDDILIDLTNKSFCCTMSPDQRSLTRPHAEVGIGL